MSTLHTRRNPNVIRVRPSRDGRRRKTKRIAQFTHRTRSRRSCPNSRYDRCTGTRTPRTRRSRTGIGRTVRPVRIPSRRRRANTPLCSCNGARPAATGRPGIGRTVRSGTRSNRLRTSDNDAAAASPRFIRVVSTDKPPLWRPWPF